VYGNIFKRKEREHKEKNKITQMEIIYKTRKQKVQKLNTEINNTQGEHKKTLHFQNDTENKCGVLRTSHLHQSTKKHSKFCFK
jgi:hypothetical protein